MPYKKALDLFLTEFVYMTVQIGFSMRKLCKKTAQKVQTTVKAWYRLARVYYIWGYLIHLFAHCIMYLA